MSEEAKVYTCSVCGKPTPNYHEWLPSVAAILGEPCLMAGTEASFNEPRFH